MIRTDEAVSSDSSDGETEGSKSSRERLAMLYVCEVVEREDGKCEI